MSQSYKILQFDYFSSLICLLSFSSLRFYHMSLSQGTLCELRGVLLDTASCVFLIGPEKSARGHGLITALIHGNVCENMKTEFESKQCELQFIRTRLCGFLV